MKLKLRKEEMHSGALILVNAKHHVRKKNVKTLVPVTAENEGVRLEAKAAATLAQLMRDIEHEDEIVPVSGYRSAEEQGAIYRGSAAINGKEFTEKFVAL
ncbi:MAG: D-alanyl-D-alanine carboxypeptidase family protein, partial [Clostridiales bacterium]|nr:D-alanyl-D-alanine carboxypeptidase family protein [Clostridiales bacterium]